MLLEGLKNLSLHLFAAFIVEKKSGKKFGTPCRALSLLFYIQNDFRYRCSANPNWHMAANLQNQPDPGPMVLACLYRAAYNEEEPVSIIR